MCQPCPANPYPLAKKAEINQKNSPAPLLLPSPRLFTERWLLGEPVVVRGFRGRMDWTPDTMQRITRDM